MYNQIWETQDICIGEDRECNYIQLRLLYRCGRDIQKLWERVPVSTSMCPLSPCIWY